MIIDFQLLAKNHRRNSQYCPTASIGFGEIRTDHMFLCNYIDGNWLNPRIVPYGALTLAAGSMGLHYGQCIFEGAKAFLHNDGELYSFRLGKHVERLNQSAEILSMPTMPIAMQLTAIESLLDVERLWFPKQDGACIYIRPFMIASEDHLTIRSANQFTYCVMLSPSSCYYQNKKHTALRLLISKQFHRAVTGGTGSAKAAGNYGASLRAMQQAKKFGADQVLYLDSTNQYIEEAGMMNHFHVTKDHQIIIPHFTDTILKSITSQSVMALGEYVGCQVEQQTISLQTFVDDIKNGNIIEAGGFGTAAVVSAVGSYLFEDHSQLTIADGMPGSITKNLYQLYNGIQHGENEDHFNWLQKIPRTNV